MNNKLSIERIKQYATDPRMCNISDELRSGMVELLAYREAESKPVAVVETSDYFTASQLTGTEPRRKAVRELYEGGLVIGQKLYVSPALGQTPIITEQHKAVIESLLKLAYAAWDACDDSEQVNDGVEEYHKIIPRTFDLISDALDELEALPNDQPGFDMQAAAQARWALRDILVESASQVLGQTSESINSELLEASQPVGPDAMPMQPIIVDEYGTYRFKANAIVNKLQEVAASAGYDLHAACRDNYSDEEWMQLAQLIGYSITGYSELSYVSDESYSRALSAAPALQDDE